MLYKNDPPGRTIFDCGSLTYDYPNGVKMSFTQNVFHPASMPNGNQYVYVYGTKGAVDLETSTFYPLEKGGKPTVLAEKVEEDRHAHVAAFFEAVRGGTERYSVTASSNESGAAVGGTFGASTHHRPGDRPLGDDGGSL